MRARPSRFEVVRTDAGWHARFRSANSRIVWVTETYRRRGSAVGAIASVAQVFYGHVMHGEQAVTCLSARDSWNKVDRPVAEIRYVDERTVTP
jgi:uncharacterized protein YegP (UPF0339 family)